jgi:hypothetical protein
VVKALGIDSGISKSEGSRPAPTWTSKSGRSGTAATLAPDTVLAVLRKMLPLPAPPAHLILPAAARPRFLTTAFHRAAAAGAITALATTHTDLAAGMIRTLVLDLGVPPDDDYNDPALPAGASRADCNAPSRRRRRGKATEEAGRTGSMEHRDALFSCVHPGRRLDNSEGLWREPGDPSPDEGLRAELIQSVLAVAVARLSGDWGDDVRIKAARLVENLARLDPHWMVSNLAQ